LIEPPKQAAVLVPQYCYHPDCRCGRVPHVPGRDRESAQAADRVCHPGAEAWRAHAVGASKKAHQRASSCCDQYPLDCPICDRRASASCRTSRSRKAPRDALPAASTPSAQSGRRLRARRAVRAQPLHPVHALRALHGRRGAGAGVERLRARDPRLHRIIPMRGSTIPGPATSWTCARSARSCRRTSCTKARAWELDKNRVGVHRSRRLQRHPRHARQRRRARAATRPISREPLTSSAIMAARTTAG